jgi:hypothetical protein
MYITNSLLVQPSDNNSKNSMISSNQDELLADLKIWEHPFQGTQSRPLKGFPN